jgi:hypothetical protein
MGEITYKYGEIIASSMEALFSFLKNSIKKDLEVIRIARTAKALFDVGNFSDTDNYSLQAYLIDKQHSDGGWSDPEETAWATSLLAQISGNNNEVTTKARTWLDGVRHSGGGWGRHARDQARIPTTGLVMALVPAVTTDADREWIQETWKDDLARPVHLSYKGGFYLLSVNNKNKEPIDSLVLQTIVHLAGDQNDDGGFGPWKNHPIGSDPWSTGIVLWGLSKWIDCVDPKVIEYALTWLKKTQLTSGYWPYHYLDEGTSYALIGAVAASRALENRK